MSEQAPCPRCRHANPPENRFCGLCGGSLGAGNDLVAHRGGTPTVESHALPAKLGPAGAPRLLVVLHETTPEPHRLRRTSENPLRPKFAERPFHALR